MHGSRMVTSWPLRRNCIRSRTNTLSVLQSSTFCQGERPDRYGGDPEPGMNPFISGMTGYGHGSRERNKVRFTTVANHMELIKSNTSENKIDKDTNEYLARIITIPKSQSSSSLIPQLINLFPPNNIHTRHTPGT
jgi:hypothetical protein